MKKKLKYNFLHIIPLHYSKFCNSFLLCCSLSCHLFVIPNVQKRHRKTIISGGKKIQKSTLLFNKAN